MSDPGSGTRVTPPAFQGGFRLREGGVPVLVCDGLRAPHGFSTRRGGVGHGPYATLNLAYSAGDDRQVVATNKARFREALALPRDPLTLHQVHSPRGVLVRCGEEPPAAGDVQGDWLVAEDPAVPVGVFAADCTPVLIEDRRTGAVAAVHSGWRGTAADAVGEAIAGLRGLGSDPADMAAAIGPTIGACCYQVGPEVARALGRVLSVTDDPPEDDAAAELRALALGVVSRDEGDRYRADLPAAVALELARAGVPEDRIHRSGICTSCQSELCFSYRRDGAASGRMLAVIRPHRRD